MGRRTVIRYAISLLFLLFPIVTECAPPSRTYDYVDGAVIEPAEVKTNEDNIFNYLTRGVDTYANSSITTDAILDGTLVNADISGSAGITYGKLSLGSSILTGDIKDGEIVNADISGSAAIAISKLASTPMLYSDTRSKTITSTRSMTAVSGDVSYTGVGFTPTSIIAFADIDNTPAASWGFSDKAKGNNCIMMAATDARMDGGAYLIYIENDASTEYQLAQVKTYDADGFTLTWTLSAASPPAGTANLKFICYR